MTNEKSDDETVIDATTRAVIKTIAVGKRPRGVAASPDGRCVYFSNTSSDSFSVIDAQDLAVLTTVPAGLDPEGLTLDKSGTWLYVVNENELAVTVLDVASLFVVQKIEVGKEPETAVLIDTATRTVIKKAPGSDTVLCAFDFQLRADVIGPDHRVDQVLDVISTGRRGTITRRHRV